MVRENSKMAKIWPFVAKIWPFVAKIWPFVAKIWSFLAKIDSLGCFSSLWFYLFK